MNHESHCRKILKHLRTGKTLTKLQILDKFDCIHGGGRIHDLRNKGWDIQTDMVRTREGKRIAEYSLQ